MIWCILYFPKMAAFTLGLSLQPWHRILLPAYWHSASRIVFYWCHEHNISWTFAYLFLLTPYTLMGVFIMIHCQLQLYDYILHSIQLLQHMYSISRHLLAFIPWKACNSISRCLMIISTKQDNHSSSVDGNLSIDRSIRVLSQYQFLCLSRCAISYYFLISVVCSFLICMRSKHM